MPSNLDDLTRLLEQLGTATEAIPFSNLYGLSDLTEEELVEFRAAWPAFPVALRRHLVQSLAELAEASFEVNFDAIFRVCLDDPDDEVRAGAIDGLWENEQLVLIGPLLTMMRSDPSPRVRAAAAAGLGRYVLAGELERLDQPIQSRILTELLTTIHLARESVEVRRRAIESASYACMPEVFEALELAYYDEDERMRISAIMGMGRSCDPQWKEVVLNELESSSAAMRYEAAIASGELALGQATSILGDMIDDADRQVRDAAIWALGQIGGERAKTILLRAYNEADEDTRAALEDALAEQALAEGELDFPLYEVDEETGNDLIDDELYLLWEPDEEDADDDENTAAW